MRRTDEFKCSRSSFWYNHFKGEEMKAKLLLIGNMILFTGATLSFGSCPLPICLLIMAIGASFFGFVQFMDT